MAKLTLEKFRKEAAKRRAGRPRGAARYTDELKAFALAHADKRMAEGRSGKQVAAELDLCAVTLYGWQKERRAPKGELKPVVVRAASALPAPRPSRTAAKSVEAKAEPRSAGLTLRTPSGYEGHGLDVEAATTLLKALS